MSCASVPFWLKGLNGEHESSAGPPAASPGLHRRTTFGTYGSCLVIRQHEVGLMCMNFAAIALLGPSPPCNSLCALSVPQWVQRLALNFVCVQSQNLSNVVLHTMSHKDGTQRESTEWQRASLLRPSPSHRYFGHCHGLTVL